MVAFLETFERLYGQEPDFMGRLIDIYFYTIGIVIVVQYLVMKRKKKIEVSMQAKPAAAYPSGKSCETDCFVSCIC